MRALALILVVACNAPARGLPAEASGACKQVAHDFAAALVAGDFTAASEMTTARYRATTSPAQLQERFAAMVAPIGKLGAVQVMTTMADWPAKRAADVGWAYVAISGDGASEGITVVITSEQGVSRVRDVEWGRP